MDNAALLQKAGVQASRLYRAAAILRKTPAKIRQTAGNAVANGLPWEAGLAGHHQRTRRMRFGVGDKVGRIEVGLIADLVLWNGDPLDVTSTFAEQVWMNGQAMPMGNRVKPNCAIVTCSEENAIAAGLQKAHLISQG